MKRGTILFWVVSVGLFCMPFLYYWLNQKTVDMVPISIQHVPTTMPVGIQVHVSGAVEFPGVYTVSVGTKIHDLLTMLRLKGNADITHLNLAKTLRDGQKIKIKSKQQSLQSVNINLATIQQLQQLPGIGLVTAKKIITYRLASGAITNEAQLIQIIGQSKVRRIQPYIVY